MDEAPGRQRAAAPVDADETATGGKISQAKAHSDDEKPAVSAPDLPDDHPDGNDADVAHKTANARAAQSEAIVTSDAHVASAARAEKPAPVDGNADVAHTTANARATQPEAIATSDAQVTVAALAEKLDPTPFHNCDPMASEMYTSVPFDPAKTLPGPPFRSAPLCDEEDDD